MEKLKAVGILAVILFSLLLFHSLYTFLQQKMKPRATLSRFLFFQLVVLIVIFLYTFSLVLGIKLLFPGA